MRIPLISLEDQEKFRQSQFLKAEFQSRFGTIVIPDWVPATEMKNMLEAGGTRMEPNWRQYDCHLLETQLDVNPNPGYQVEWVNISCTLNPQKPPEDRPYVRKVFPETEWVDGNFQISGNFGASASLDFGPLTEMAKKYAKSDLKAKGEVLVPFSYKPRIARIHSGAAGSSCHWQFTEAKGEYPVGGLILKAIIICPRRLSSPLEAQWEMSAKFKNWKKDYPVARHNTKLEFSPSPLPG